MIKISDWTYVTGVIEISAIGETQPEMRYIIDTVLAHLPLVTGSERNMEIHVVQESGSNESSSHDEFGVYSEYMLPGRKWIDLQSKYMLVLKGDLRDRYFEDTFKELNRFLNRLAKRLVVTDIMLKLCGCPKSGGECKQYIYTDPDKYSDMFEMGSWANETGEPAWWEYLRWDKNPDTMLPISLTYKYYEDKENDIEWKRRKRWERGSSR